MRVYSLYVKHAATVGLYLWVWCGYALVEGSGVHLWGVVSGGGVWFGSYVSPKTSTQKNIAPCITKPPSIISLYIA